MSGHSPDNSNATVPVAPTPTAQSAHMVVDDAGRTIIAILKKASEVGKEDCARAMDAAHKLSLELNAAERRLREAEAQVAHFRERATRAEAWLVRIHNEAEQVFFQKNERDSRGTPIERSAHAPSLQDNRSNGRADDARTPLGADLPGFDER